MKSKEVVLTGDRPTGPLHLVHFVGSLVNRVKLQDEHENQFIMIADTQALTDNALNPQKVRDNVLEVALDYLAVGLEPEKDTFFIQSLVPELAELTIYFLNLVSLARLERNPTVKSEIISKKFERNIPAGFLVYPVSQAADITLFKSTLIPVGGDQLPMIEQTNEIVRKFNHTYKTSTLKECQSLLTKTTRLPGLDGKSKMSKSLKNCIYLKDEPDLLERKVMSMYTDPNHLKVSDPGQVEGNMVFAYLDCFDKDQEQVKELKEAYKKGGLGDMVLKRRLNTILQELLAPIRERRTVFAKDSKIVMSLLREGSARARGVGRKTMEEVRSNLLLDY